MTNLARFLLLAGVAGTAALAAPAAQAFPPPGTPITVNPGPVTGNGGPVSAIYAFANAGDRDQLSLTGFGGNPIFDNQTNVAGDTVFLGNLAGSLPFTLANLSTGITYGIDTADVFGDYHAFYSMNFADFSVGALPAATAAAIAALPPGSSVLFVGFEDLQADNGSDFDYNDLIFAFSNTTARVPEPATLAVLGLGLAGLGLVRRKRA